MERLTTQELKVLCKSRGLAVSGIKEDLVRRLQGDSDAKKEKKEIAGQKKKGAATAATTNKKSAAQPADQQPPAKKKKSGTAAASVVEETKTEDEQTVLQDKTNQQNTTTKPKKAREGAAVNRKKAAVAKKEEGKKSSTEEKATTSRNEPLAQPVTCVLTQVEGPTKVDPDSGKPIAMNTIMLGKRTRVQCPVVGCDAHYLNFQDAPFKRHWETVHGNEESRLAAMKKIGFYLPERYENGKLVPEVTADDRPRKKCQVPSCKNEFRDLGCVQYKKHIRAKHGDQASADWAELRQHYQNMPVVLSNLRYILEHPDDAV